MISIDWDGMTVDEKEEDRTWRKDFVTADGKESLEKHDNFADDLIKMEENLRKALDERRRECRCGCGARIATSFCTVCKETCESFSYNLLVI